MRLLSLQLSNYRRFGHTELYFPDGVTGVVGNNGSGKSSLMEAIAWTIYGTSRSAKDEIISLNGTEGYCQSVLTLEIDSKQYEIVRFMGGKNLATKMSIFTVDLGEKVLMAKGVKPCEQLLEQLTGLDQHSFETSFFAKQHQLNALSNLQAAARKKRIIKMLKIDVVEKAKELVKKDIAHRQAKAEGMAFALTDPNEIRVKLKRTETELAQSTAEHKKQKEETAQTESVFNQAKARFEEDRKIEQQYLNLKNKYNNLDTLKKLLVEDLADKAEELGKLTKLDKEYLNLKPCIAKARKLDKELKDCEKQKSKHYLYKMNKEKYDRLLDELKNIKESISKLLKKEKDLVKIRTDLKELDSIKKKDAQFAKMNQEYARLQALGEQAVADINKIKERLKGTKTLKEEDKCPLCLGPLKGRLSQIKMHYENELQKVLSKSGEISTKQKVLKTKCDILKHKLEDSQSKKQYLIQLRERYSTELLPLEEYKIRQTQLLKQLKALKGAVTEIPAYDEKKHNRLLQNYDNFRKKAEQAIILQTKLGQRDELLRKKSQIELRLGNVQKELKAVSAKGKALGFDKNKSKKIKEGYEKSLSALETSKLKLRDLEWARQSILKDKNKYKAELDEIKNKKTELKKLKKQTENLALLVSAYDDFKKQLIGRIRPALSEKASNLITRLTDSRYTQLELTPDYDILLYDGSNKYVIDRFSGGEKDLANLCLRLAISELMAESSRSEFNFIILDEVFGSQDAIRKNNIITTLHNLSKCFRQLFVITHVEDIKEMVDTVIEVKETGEQTSEIVIS